MSKWLSFRYGLPKMDFDLLININTVQCKSIRGDRAYRLYVLVQQCWIVDWLCI